MAVAFSLNITNWYASQKTNLVHHTKFPNAAHQTLSQNWNGLWQEFTIFAWSQDYD